MKKLFTVPFNYFYFTTRALNVYFSYFFHRKILRVIDHTDEAQNSAIIGRLKSRAMHEVISPKV